jgi:hypothetical protein
MKILVTVLASVLFASIAIAQIDVSTSALATLMAKNPVAISSGRSEKVSTLLASIMTSAFDKDGKGYLSVIHNTCTAQGENFQCRLHVLNSDRVMDARGAYAPASGMTESSLSIEYTVDTSGNKLVGAVKFFFAG